MASHDPQVIEFHTGGFQKADDLDRFFMRLRLEQGFPGDMGQMGNRLVPVDLLEDPVQAR